MPVISTLIIAELTITNLLAQAAIRFAVSFAISMVVSRVFGADRPTQVDPGQRQQLPPSATNPLPVVYGDAWLGGTFVDAVLSTDSKTMYYVLAISSISTNGAISYDRSAFYYGDRLITFDGTDPTKVVSLTDGAGNVDTKINGYLFVNLYTSSAAGGITTVTGTSPSTFMGGSDIAVGLRWPASGRQMHGTAFAIVKLIYNREAGATGLQPLTFKVSQYLNGAGVARPGDVLFDYLTNTVYGASIPAANVNSTACAALNTYSDATITYTPSGGGSATKPRYRINGVINTGETVLRNIDRIMLACDSWLSYAAALGQWSPVVHKAESIAFAFNDSNIVGEIQVSVSDLTSSVNEIETSFPSRLNKDQPEYVRISTPSAQLFPNEPVNKYTQSLDLVNDSVQAQYLSNRVLKQAREDLIVTFSTTYDGIQVDAGDVITIANAEYGWSAKSFRVLQVTEVALPDGTLGAKIQGTEYNAAVYDDAAITEFAAAPNSGLESVYFFSAVAAPTLTDLAPSATIPTFSVNAVIPADGRVNRVMLYYTTVAVPAVSDWRLWGSQSAINSTTYTPAASVKFANISLPAATYYFAARVANETATSALSSTSASHVWSPTGTAGTQVATATLYQWLSTTPGNPSGSSTFTWASGAHSAYTGGNGWQTAQPANPGTAGLYLWTATIAVTAAAGVASTSVSWSSGYSVQAIAGNGTAGSNGTNGTNGASGTQVATATLYQWATGSPPNPSGSSTFTWSTGANSAYTGGGGWTVTIPSNPGTPGGLLYSATTAVTAAAGVATTSVSWASGYSVQAVSGNGINGVKSTDAILYQWASTIPTISGTSTYTWATGAISSLPTGWFPTVSESTNVNWTLWEARVPLQTDVASLTSTVNWSTATILPFAYVGATGAFSRLCFSKTTLSTLNSTPTTITVAGDTTFPAANSWGTGTSWSDTVPTLAAGETLWQSDGVYNPGSGNTIWSVPYLSAFKVGSLSALSLNTGVLAVSGSITVGKSGNIKGGQTAYATGTGFFLGYSGAQYKFSIGSATNSFQWDGTNLAITGGSITAPSFTTASGTGQRITINEPGNANKLRAYDSSNNLRVEIGGGSGNIYSTSASTINPTISGESSATSAGGAFNPGVKGASSGTGYALFGNATGTSEAGYFLASGNHAARGKTTSASHYGGYFENSADTTKSLYAAGGGMFAGKVYVGGSTAHGVSVSGGNVFLDSSGASYMNAGNGAILYVSTTLVTPNGDNFASLGNSANRWSTVWADNGSIQTSDERTKNILGPNPYGLDFINQIETIAYRYKVGSNEVTGIDENKNPVLTPRAGTRVHHGVRAQQLRAVLDTMNQGDFAGWVLTDTSDPTSEQAVRYTEFIAPLIKAVQELSAKVAELESRIESA